jgi:selenide,water dikinase
VGPGDLHELMKGLGATAPRDRDAEVVLVATETGDDAGVILLNPSAASGIGIVQTADFITPPFDDPEAYGEIAAANALSDVYAMGGRPISALNLCVFPAELDPTAARAILHGAQTKLHQAGAALLGGHTVRGPELLFGLAVTGVVAPDRIWRNVGARPGDSLLLTKPLGGGLVVTGVRKGLVSDDDCARCKAGMALLNRRAAEILADYQVHAATDVTGFGLIGHALGMTNLGEVSLQFFVPALPIYEGALALAAAGVTCGGAKNNRRAYKERIAIRGALSAAYEELLFDPQTSGGLLCALPASAATAALDALGAAGIRAVQVGKVLPRQETALIIDGDGNADRPLTGRVAR